MKAVTYSITIHDLHRIEGGLMCGDEAVVSILDSGREVRRERFIGKCSAPAGYTRTFRGQPGLVAKLISGSCRMEFGLSKPSTAAPVRP
ncbi:hypothetical protein ACIOWK_34400 [Pseudomonas protegens]|uniref:Uncharacterized protein n=1 Tax=Pseudomonas protegens TaxID=380021 RepID=A0A2T6GBB4_9PSED|nr:hypothetical protein [Pseudomonas protegens]PUA41442.1 hypothetical protein C5U62_31910 [Pseudomonas protegens]